MLVDLLLFPAYAYLILFIGLGFFRCVTYFVEIEPPAHHFGIVLLMGQFCIGLTSLTINFFVGVAHPVIYNIFFVFFLFGAPQLRHYGRTDHLLLLTFSVLLVPLAAYMPPSYDAGLYHLPHQLWIRDEKIVFGLANFHGRFGFSSFQEYISAPQWIDGHFKLLAYSSVLYAVSFLLFLWKWICSKKQSIMLVGSFFAVSILFIYILRVKKILFYWEYCFTDNQAGFLFAMAFLTGFELLNKCAAQEEISQSDIFILFFLSLFAFLLKLSTLFIFFWAFFVVITLLLYKKLQFLQTIRLAVLPVIILFMWMVKNLIVSGCFFYPFAGSCVDFFWTARRNAIFDSSWITAWARHPKSGLYSLDGWSWLNSWWFPEYHAYIYKMLIICGILFGISCIIALSEQRPFHLSMRKIAGLLFLLLTLLFWFIKAPTPRFGVGIFIALPPLLGILMLDDSLQNFRYAKWYQYVGKVVIIVLGIVIGGWEMQHLSKDGLTYFDPIKVGSPPVAPDTIYGVRPQGTDRCWLVPECSPFPRSAPEYGGGYLFFAPLQDQQ